MKSEMFNKNKLILIVFVLVFFLTFSIVVFLNKEDSYVIERKNINLVLNQEDSDNEWFKEQHDEQWIKNSKFEDDEDEGWSKEVKGDASDLDANIDGEQANFIVSGESHSFTPLSGTIDNSTGENYYSWHNASNPEVPALPTCGNRYVENNGFYASHEWEDNSSDTRMICPNQRASVQWEKIIRTPHYMSDYRVISASFEMLINATVKATPRNYNLADSPGGIEVYGDSGTSQGYISSGDYITYYARISDIDRNYTREFLEYTPIGLGKDTAVKWDSLNDTVISPEFSEDVIQYLNEVFKLNSREFLIILGIEFFSEDNCPDADDWDFFNSTYIKACDFNFNYEKMINKESTVSWTYKGNQIDNKGGNVEIVDSKLYIDYKVNGLLALLSPSSGINIIICDNLLPNSLSISRGKATFEEANKKGFDVADLIDEDDNITIEIQLSINNDFILSNGKYYISIDDAILEIKYEIYISAQQSLLLQILIILGIVGLLCFSFYIIYYQKVLKYPKPIRKVRKFRKTLHKQKEPKVDILNRLNGFMKVYRSKTHFYDTAIQESQLGIKMGIKSRKKIITKKKLLKIKDNTYAIFLLIIVFLGFLAIPLFSNNLNSQSFKQNNTLTISQSSGAFQLIRESHEKQWIKNSEFDSYEDWISVKRGDLNDIDAEISGSEVKIKIIGDRRIILFNESNPINKNWVLLKNENNITQTVVKQITQYGWNISHKWEDGNPTYKNQFVISKWQKNFSLNNLGFEPSDYRIISASLQAYINASVMVTPAGRFTTGGGGFDQIGDTPPTPYNEFGIAIGDYVNYFISISDWERERILPAVSYQTVNLGKDNPPTPTLNNTKIFPSTEETLIYYLNQILENNNHNFSLIVGFKVWGEDNSDNDGDVLNYANLKNLTLSLTLEKNINKESSISWIYQGGKINTEKKKVEITGTELNFDYRINNEGYSNIISNSEIRIYINNEEHFERVSLKNAKSSMEEVKEGGFDVTSIIPEDEEINLEIRITITDDALLEDDFVISFDNVELDISYDLITEVEQIVLWPILIGIVSLISFLIGYYIYYQRVLKYPKPIRKLRKFRKSLDKTVAPNVKIIDSKTALMNVYEAKTSSAQKIFNEIKDEKKSFAKEVSVEHVNAESKEIVKKDLNNIS